MPEGNLLIGDFHTRNDIPVERVRQAAEEVCEKILIIGIDKNGKPYYSASFADGKQMLWMIEQFKHKLLSGKFS